MRNQLRQCGLEDGVKNLCPGQNHPDYRAAYLGRSHLLAVTDRYLHAPKSFSSRLDLHFDSPTVIDVAHAEAFETRVNYMTKGIKVGVLDT